MKTKNLFFMVGLMFLLGIIKGNAQNNLVQTTATASPGQFNVILGINAGLNSSTDPTENFRNVFIGYNSGLNTANGLNTFVGYESGKANVSGDYNTFVGFQSGLANISGRLNTFLGARNTGVANTSGDENVFIGSESAENSQTGSRNTFVGKGSGRYNISGNNNCFFGNSAGYQINSGNNNICIGTNAGLGITTGSANVIIGGANGLPANLTGTVIISDGGTNGPTPPLNNQRIYIDSNGYTGIGLGNNSIPLNRLELGSGISGTSGLRFRSYLNTNFSALTTATTPKVLSVNASGDVILVDDAVGSGSGSDNDWHLRGNFATTPALTRQESATPASDFLGTIDNQDLVFRVNNFRSGLIQTTVVSNNNFSTKANTSFGFDSLSPSNLTGVLNTAIGTYSLHANTTGFDNTALGAGSLQLGTGGTDNTAVGVNSLRANGSTFNVAVGSQAMPNNATGGSDTAIGANALGGMTSGGLNVAVGRSAGTTVVSGNNNVFIGANAGPTGTGNTLSNALYIDSEPFTPTNTNPLILGDFSTQNLTFNVANNANSRVLINSFGTNTNTSGLRFQDLNSSFTPTTTANKFLTVDTAGDVVLKNLPTFTDTDAQTLSILGSTLTISNGNSITLPTSGTACNLYTCDGTIVTPSTPTIDNPIPGLRTVTMGNNNLMFKTNATYEDGLPGTGRVYIGSTLNNFPAYAVTSSTTSHYRLLVEGGILTEKVKVAMANTSDWQDSVFANEYKLMPLNKVEAFVKENKHLPGIDSAENLVKTGLDLGEMQSKQMGKIEELTLYIIEQDKAIENQKEIVEKQNNEIEELKAAVKVLLEKSK